MQQDPYAAFARPVGPAQSAPADPYAGFAAPVGVPPAPSRQPRPQAARPAAPAMAPAPAPVQTIGDSGLTRDEIYAAQRAQGYGDGDIAANIEEMFGPQGGAATEQPAYGVLSSEDISPQEAERLIASGEYQRDPATGNVFRYVAPPAAAPDAPAAPEAQTGYDLARAQETAKSEALGEFGEASFTDQFTAPINDELGWAAGYGGQAIDNLIRRLTGREMEVSALDRARAIRDVTLDNQNEFESEKPVQALAGGMLGGFAFAPARGAAIPGLLGRLGQSFGVGSAYGAAEGDGVAGRIGSGALSGVVSMGTAGALEGVVPLARGLMGLKARAGTPSASLPTNPERRVGRAITRALENDRTAPADVIANMAQGRRPFAAGGENLLGLAETAAQVPGQARTALVQTAKEIQDGATNRVSDQLSDQFGADGNFYVTLRDRVRQQRETARQGMAEIGDTPLSLSPDAQTAIRSPRAQAAIADAAENRLSSMDPEVRAQGERLRALTGDGPVNVGGMTIRDAQEVSFALNEAASGAFASGDGARGAALRDLGKAIRQNARDQSTEYGTWLARYGDDAEANDALRVGKNLFARPTERNAMSVPELRERWADWSDLAKENFRLGVGEAVLDRVRAGGGVPALRRVLKDQDVSERIGLAFGEEDGFARFMQFATDETTLQGQLNQILGNSATARRQAGRADLERQGFDPLDFVEAAADFTNPVGAGRQALRLAAKNLPRRDRSILGDEELNGLLGSALTNEAAMTRLLNLMQTQEGLQARVADQARRFGLISVPGAAAGGQERARGLLTTSP